MSIESTIILENLGDQSPNLSIYTFTDKFIGAGYYRKHSGLHTVQYNLNEFLGSIKIQGTLELYPGESDWVDLLYSNGNAIETEDSATLTGTYARNIIGNWVWIRAAYILEQGTIGLVRYNI